MDPRQREKTIMLGGIAFIAIMLVAFMVAFSVVKANELDMSIASGKKTLRELRETAAEYATLSRKSQNMERKLTAEGPPLLTHLANLCAEAKIPSPNLKPLRTGSNEYFDENSVEMKVQGLNLEQVMELLRLINTSQVNLKVKSFKLDTPYSKKEYLDMSMVVSSYTLKKEGTPAPGGEAPPQ